MHRVLFVTALPVLSACQSVEAQTSETYFDGQIFFWSEFNLYQYGRDSNKSDVCISGTLPAAQQITAKDLFDGKMVRVYGTKMKYSNLDDIIGLEKSWKGAPILNYCSGDEVILATKISRLP